MGKLFNAEEFETIRKLCATFSDREQKESFWNECQEKKRNNPRWSIWDEFPEMRNEKTKVEQAREECVKFVKGLRRAENDVG